MQIFYFRSSSLPVSQRHCTKIPSSRVDKSPVFAHLQNSLFCAYRMSVQHNLTRSLLSSLSLIMLLHTCAWVYYIHTFIFKVSVQVCTSFLSIIHAGNEPVTETCLRISCLKNAASSRPLTLCESPRCPHLQGHLLFYDFRASHCHTKGNFRQLKKQEIRAWPKTCLLE